MDRRLTGLAFWSFQIINTLTASVMTFFPGRFHEILFKNPAWVYEKLGFSRTAVEMVHNLIRGQGAVLLAVSVFVWMEGRRSRSVYLLISIVCTLSVYSHVMALKQHLGAPAPVNALGSLASLYGIILITAVVGLLNFTAYAKWEG